MSATVNDDNHVTIHAIHTLGQVACMLQSHDIGHVAVDSIIKQIDVYVKSLAVPVKTDNTTH